MDDDNKKEVLFFHCEKSLKENFYKICTKKGVNPHSLIRSFMRKVVKEDGIQKDKEDKESEKT